MKWNECGSVVAYFMVGLQGVDWINLIQNRVHWRTFEFHKIGEIPDQLSDLQLHKKNFFHELVIPMRFEVLSGKYVDDDDILEFGTVYTRR
jgi:hypothetical protein